MPLTPLSSVFGIEQDNLREEESMPVLMMKETPRPASTATETKLEEQVRRRAYQLYEARGRKNGNDLEDWVQAEIDITGNATPEPQAER